MLPNILNEDTTIDSKSIVAYLQLAPVPASISGITLPATVEPTVAGMTNVNNTDMGAVALVDRRWTGGSTAGQTGWFQPAVSAKRHGVTRGRPPREPQKGL